MNKGRLNNHDFIPLTQYNLSCTIKQLPDLSLLEQLPNFKALDFKNIKGSSHIPSTVQSNSPEALFSLFFTTSVLDIIVRYTNLNAERVYTVPVTLRALNSRFHGSLKQRPWVSINSDEILVYLRIQIYIGIHIELYINDY